MSGPDQCDPNSGWHRQNRGSAKQSDGP
jgi:hypothetical protein